MTPSGSGVEIFRRLGALIRITNRPGSICIDQTCETPEWDWRRWNWHRWSPKRESQCPQQWSNNSPADEISTFRVTFFRLFYLLMLLWCCERKLKNFPGELLKHLTIMGNSLEVGAQQGWKFVYRFFQQINRFLWAKEQFAHEKKRITLL